jgi:hypothetical protein
MLLPWRRRSALRSVKRSGDAGDTGFVESGSVMGIFYIPGIRLCNTGIKKRGWSDGVME